MKPTTTILTIFLTALNLMAVPFENLKFSQNIDTNAVQSISSSNDGSLYMTSGKNQGIIPQSDGITFLVQDDGDINFVFQEDDENIFPIDNPTDRIFINGKTLKKTIEDIVQ